MPAASSLRVLVVDDQQSMRQLVCAGLEQIGIRAIEEAADGEEGALKLAARPAHLVISDYNMPKLDGLGLLRVVRLHPQLSKTAFILLTGQNDSTIVARGMELGLNNYIVKPVTAGALQRKIEAVFGMLT